MSSPTIEILPCDRDGSLIKTVRRLLEADAKKRSRTQLATDLGLPYHWLNSFAKGEIDAPSVNRIEFLYKALSGSNLPL